MCSNSGFMIDLIDIHKYERSFQLMRQDFLANHFKSLDAMNIYQGSYIKVL